MKIYSKRIALRIVSKSGWKLAQVANQTEEICLAAVKNAGWALAHVKKQTPEICLAAVMNYGKALEYVENQTTEICLAAVTEDPSALRYVNDQTEEICLLAIERDLSVLKEVRDQTENICMAAIDIDAAAINYIWSDKLTPKVLYYAAKKYLSDLDLDIDSLIDNYIAERDKINVPTPNVLTVGDIASKMQDQLIYIYKGSCVDDYTIVFEGDVKDLPKEHANLEIEYMHAGIDEDIGIHVK